MKMDMNINLATLPAGVVDAAIKASGATTPRALVMAALKKLAAGPDGYEPLTPAQGRKTISDAIKRGAKFKLLPGFEKYGLKAEDLMP